jgi:hypothetical protein
VRLLSAGAGSGCHGRALPTLCLLLVQLRSPRRRRRRKPLCHPRPSTP